MQIKITKKYLKILFVLKNKHFYNENKTLIIK